MDKINKSLKIAKKAKKKNKQVKKIFGTWKLKKERIKKTEGITNWGNSLPPSLFLCLDFLPWYILPCQSSFFIIQW